MLSNPSSNLQARQRQHRRQNSTPTAFNALKVTSLPNIPRHASHRRGMSLDQNRQQQPPAQDSNTVSNTNNQGFQTTQQHILRETQQHRLARPGQRSINNNNDENCLDSPDVSSQRQNLDPGCVTNFSDPSRASFTYPGLINTNVPLEIADFRSSVGSDFSLYSGDGSLTPSAYFDFSAAFDNAGQSSGLSSKRSSFGRRISGGIADRVSQFENLAMQSPLNHRPITPPNQNAMNYFPPTPTDTPYGRVKYEHNPQRFLDDYDTSMEETIKPKGNQRARGIFDEMRQAAEVKSMPSPPQTVVIPSAKTFDSAPMPTANMLSLSSINLEFMQNNSSFEQPGISPTSSNVSYQPSPEVSQLPDFQDPFTSKPILDSPGKNAFSKQHDGLPVTSSPRRSVHRRSESASSINLDETITETGITIDDIANFISGPDQEGKWLCLYPDCDKKFGRKENIKSHVQTHLGDRQFQCPHCQKCFVRQHDLKRHAKIHSGIKPYPCQCGNSFARHDALTRHRQRGMCIGAFEGIVKKNVKRGRPRKHRPDDEERVKKASRTRAKNKTISSASSTSGYSSTSGQSPRSDADVLDDKPFGDLDYSQSSNHNIDNGSFQYSQPHIPMSSTYVSPQLTQTALSPSVFSIHSVYSEHHDSDNYSSLPASPAKSIHSQYHSPPELVESASSPAANNFYDFDSASNHGDGLGNLSGLQSISEHDDEMFLQAFAAASNDISQLERNPTLLMGKFDDSFGATEGDDLFKANSDVFFGSP